MVNATPGEEAQQATRPRPACPAFRSRRRGRPCLPSAVTSAGTGCMAALDAEAYLETSRRKRSWPSCPTSGVCSRRAGTGQPPLRRKSAAHSTAAPSRRRVLCLHRSMPKATSISPRHSPTSSACPPGNRAKLSKRRRRRFLGSASPTSRCAARVEVRRGACAAWLGDRPGARARADLCAPRPGTDVLSKLRRGHWSLQGELDLHGMNSDEARGHACRFLLDARARGARCFRVIHGKGSPRLERTGRRARCADGLRTGTTVLAYCEALTHAGGGGAVADPAARS